MPVLADEEGVLLASHTRVGAAAGPIPTIRTRDASSRDTRKIASNQ
jgi:hypothetical protein